MITNEVVNKGIDYIVTHLNEKITLDEVASHCHFSKFYFSRFFKAEMGESVYAFIKRLKIERSSVRLSTHKDEKIIDIGYDFGYSPSNYSTVFKEHHNISPAGFRKNRKLLLTEHPFSASEITYYDFDYYDKRMKVETFVDMYVLYTRYLGNYKELSAHWCVFMEKYQMYHKEETLYIERSYDDPSITETDRCIYDICMTIDDDCLEENKMTIKGGKYIVYKFDGSTNEIFEAYQGIFNIWFPRSGYELDERIGFDIYRETDALNDHFVMDICIPIK